MNVSGTELRVCEDITKRQQKGISKYNTTVENNPLSLQEWIQHAYEECLDMAIYLKRALEKTEEKPHLVLSEALHKWVLLNLPIEAMDHQCENDT